MRPSFIFGMILLLVILGFSLFWNTTPKDPHPANAAAIEAGRDWLRRHQGTDGLWSGGGFPVRCIGTPRCPAEPLFAPLDPALTGLALVALNDPPEATAPRFALPRLQEVPADGPKGLFNVLMAALARRGPAPGFDVGTLEDCHAGWALDLGADPQRLLDLLDRQLLNGQTSTQAIDAIRALVLLALRRPAPDVKAALDAFADTSPIEREPDLFLWYWALRALKAAGDPRLAEWSPFIRARLLATQVADGSCARGSWEPRDAWKPFGGRIYATALGVMILDLIDEAAGRR